MAVEAYRALEPGMGEAVASRTVLRTDAHGVKETWGNVAQRVSEGNAGLHPEVSRLERRMLERHIANGTILMSGRHLQHGDAQQPLRNQEVFTNCSTAAASFIKFYLLLNGSGVGRSYNDELMLVDWDQMPELYLVLDKTHVSTPYLKAGELHPDAVSNGWVTRDEAWVAIRRAYGIPDGPTNGAVQIDVEYLLVEDSREGWAKAVELLERMAYEGRKDAHLILDFSQVRPKGAPIGGMQDRPASGPVPLMEALEQVRTIKGKGWKPWKQTLYVDHYLAACVAVGGARRAARIAVKEWRDVDILEFINIKQKEGLWSANHSVGVDEEFWGWVQRGNGLIHLKARRIFDAVVTASYEHGTGEPGFVNLDKLVRDETGLEQYLDGLFAGSERYQLDQSTLAFSQAVAKAVTGMRYKFIVNPCGEIVLLVLGGYCVLGCLAPYHAATLEEVRAAAHWTTRALMRVNMMDSLYKRETARTMRIGVGLTGFFSFAWKFFGYAWDELVDEKKSADFWQFIALLREDVEKAAVDYALEVGVNVPHTFTTIPPAGSIAKLFGLEEGAHLPAMVRYLRWVQFQKEDPLIDEYEAKGYPVQRTVPNYDRVSIVGFPTQPVIGRLGIPEGRLKTAAEATPEEQFQWVRLIEKHWLGERGNQTSYTLKYDKEKVGLEEYRAMLLKNMPTVRAISVMPSSDWQETKRRYGYVPEEPIGKEEFDQLVADIQAISETIDMDALQCASGACPL